MGRTSVLILFTLVALLTCALAADNNSASVHMPWMPRGILRDYRRSYVPTSMTVRQIRLSAGYCCNLVCSCAEVNDATAEPCAAMQDRVASLSPSLCASASHNSSSLLCPPPSGSITLCNGGASCCTHICNESCSSNLDVCACPCNHCSTCSCCKQVENRLCRSHCWPCDKVWMMLDFQDHLGKPHSVNFSRNFSLNSAEAINFYNAHKGIASIAGHFRLDDPTIVDVSSLFSYVRAQYNDDIFFGGSEEHPDGRDWAEFGAVTAFPIFTVSVILIGLLIALLLQRMRRADQRPFRIAWSVNRGLWMGIIWPLIIVLLILQVRYPVPNGALYVQLIACIGWLPLLLLWFYHIIHPQL